MSTDTQYKKSSLLTRVKSFLTLDIHRNANLYTIVDKQLYYNKIKNTYYLKIVSVTGFLCRDVTIDELLLPNSHILKSLDQDSMCYVYYLAGRLEDMANKDHNSLYTFHGFNPKDPTFIFVKSLIDLSIHEWDVIYVFKSNKYYTLDKPSIAKFIEYYYSINQYQNVVNHPLKLVNK